eukprot:scaffold79666_cov76-Cyclotella_meneghiniana.AAC.4
MFATLVLELLSEYGGAEFSVWSPLTSNEKKTYAFNDGNGLTERKTCSSSMPLTATTPAVQHPLLLHQHKPNPQHPQPADELVALELSKMVKAFADETDEDHSAFRKR